MTQLNNALCGNHLKLNSQRVKENTEQDSDNSWQLIINSIGTANADLIPILRNISPLPPCEIARLIYQAPSILASNLSQSLATEFQQLLSHTGLDVSVKHTNDELTTGIGELDLALVIDDVSRLNDTIKLITEILAVNTKTARDIACASPATLLGQVSRQTYEALKSRFISAGSNLEASQPETAIYDLFVGDCLEITRYNIIKLLTEMGIITDSTASRIEKKDSLFVGSLTNEQAKIIWERLKVVSAPVKIINREFERYDIKLNKAHSSTAIIDYLHKSMKIPKKVVEKVIINTPIFIAHNINFKRMQKILDELSELGAKASAELITLQSYEIAIDSIGDREKTQQLLTEIGEIKVPETKELIIAGKGKFDVSYTNIRARWIQYALKRVGTEARMMIQ